MLFSNILKRKREEKVLRRRKLPSESERHSRI